MSEETQTPEDALKPVVEMLAGILDRLDDLEAFRAEMERQGKGPAPYNRED